MIMVKSAVVATVLFATVIMMSMAPLGVCRSLLQQVSDDHPVDDWFKKLPNTKPVFTELSIYIHDILWGDDPSFATVAQANDTSSSPTQFGLFQVIDDQLTEEPAELNKEMVGHLEGFHIAASKENPSLLLGGTFVFTVGNYNGSTLTVLGRLTRAATNMEFPVLGGTGYFRLAQGVVTANIVQPAADAQGHQIVQCRFQLVHFPDPAKNVMLNGFEVPLLFNV